MDVYRRSLIGAVALSVALMCILVVFVRSADGQSDSDAGALVQMVSLFVLTGATISQWVRCVKQYVDYAIDRKLGTNPRKGEQEQP
jgi:hypothetical protein